MKKFYLFLLAALSLMLTKPASSQSISNTDNVITLTGTCFNPTLISGTYNLTLSYVMDNTYTVNLTGVAVVSNGNVATITAPAGSFPTVANDGYFTLNDTYNGTLLLTGGPSSGVMYWFQNEQMVINFNCIALPIWFSDFSGTQSSSSIGLSWKTLMEQNSSVIEIYRSTNGSPYYKIGQRTAAGNSSLPVSYTFGDDNPAASNLYYLKMVSNAGAQAIQSNTIQVSCSGCHYTPPTPVNCPYTINGPDHICNLETLTAYTLSSAVPDYSTLTWSLDQPSVANLHVYKSFERTKVSLLKKNTTGGVTLTATLSGCSNVITKYIAMGTPDPYITTYYFCPTLNVQLNTTPGAYNYDWYLMDASSGETVHYPGGWSNGWTLPNRDTYYVGATYTNGCGTSNEVFAYGFQCEDGGGGIPTPPDGGLSISPNPSNGLVSIGLAPENTALPMVKKNGFEAVVSAVKPKVYQVRVVDALGVVRKNFVYPGGMDRTSVDLSGLSNGVYIVQVFDNKIWKTSKVVLNK